MSWPLDPTVYAGLAVLFLGHAWLAGRVSDARPKHSLYFGLGLLALWVALETPIDTISDYYLDSVHMLQHVLLAFVAPPLMLLGLSPGMVAQVARVPGVRAVTEPIPAQVIAALIMVVWHLPRLYDATLHNAGLHVLEHLMFIASGIALYWPMLAVTSAQSRWQMSPGAKLVYMLLATLPQDAVALPLIFSRGDLLRLLRARSTSDPRLHRADRSDDRRRRTDDHGQGNHGRCCVSHLHPLVQS